jgi:epoxyqueuosine reductase
VALGNAVPGRGIVDALERRANDPSPLVREHVAWALARQREATRGERSA